MSSGIAKLRSVELDRRALLRGALATGATLPIATNLLTGATVYAQGSEDGGTLIFNNGTNPSGLDPHITGAVASWYVMDQVFDRLLRLDPETSQPGPSLAESYEVSEDGLTYTFRLRSGVKFSNGRELTSDDVKWSFERITNPDVPAVAKGYFVALDSIETPDASTVVLKYTEPFAPLPLALCRLETSILPKEAVEDSATWEVTPTGSGPFIVQSNVKDQGSCWFATTTIGKKVFRIWPRSSIGSFRKPRRRSRISEPGIFRQPRCPQKTSKRFPRATASMSRC